MVMGEQSAGELRHNCVSGNECGLEVRPRRYSQRWHSGPDIEHPEYPDVPG